VSSAINIRKNADGLIAIRPAAKRVPMALPVLGTGCAVIVLVGAGLGTDAYLFGGFSAVLWLLWTLPKWPSVVIRGASLRTAPVNGEWIFRTDVKKLLPACVESLGYEAYGGVIGKFESLSVVAELHDGREVTIIDGLATQQVAEEMCSRIAEYWDLRRDALQSFVRLDRTGATSPSSNLAR